MKNSAKVHDPEGFVRHNIRVWRGCDYSDWHIGAVLMSPRLRTREQFECWGLEYDPPTISEDPPATPAHVLNKQDSLARLHTALDRAIAGDAYVSRERLCRMAQIGNGTFQNLCVEYPDVHEKWQRLKRLNQGRTTAKGREFIRIGQARRGKLDKVAALVDQAIAEGKPVTMQGLSEAVGQYRSWLQRLCEDGCRPALAIRARINAHNSLLKQKSA